MSDASNPGVDVTSQEAPRPTSVRAYVNERGVSVPPGATVRDAVHAFDPNEALALVQGERRVTDSRGLPIDASAPVHGGAIFRLLPVRSASTVESADESVS